MKSATVPSRFDGEASRSETDGAVCFSGVVPFKFELMYTSAKQIGEKVHDQNSAVVSSCTLHMSRPLNSDQYCDFPRNRDRGMNSGI